MLAEQSLEFTARLTHSSCGVLPSLDALTSHATAVRCSLPVTQSIDAVTASSFTPCVCASVCASLVAVQCALRPCSSARYDLYLDLCLLHHSHHSRHHCGGILRHGSSNSRRDSRWQRRARGAAALRVVPAYILSRPPPCGARDRGNGAAGHGVDACNHRAGVFSDNLGGYGSGGCVHGSSSRCNVFSRHHGVDASHNIVDGLGRSARSLLEGSKGVGVALEEGLEDGVDINLPSHASRLSLVKVGPEHLLIRILRSLLGRSARSLLEGGKGVGVPCEEGLEDSVDVHLP